MTQQLDGVTVRQPQHGDESSILQLLTDTMSRGPAGPWTSSFWRWKHSDNPFGASYSLVAESQGEIIGFRTFMRWRFVSKGRTIQAVRAVDTATHPRFQGRGIFTRLTQAALARAAESGIEVVFNTPNSRSLPGYLKMGWAPVGHVPVAIRVARPFRFLLGLWRRDREIVDLEMPDIALAPAAAVLADHGDVDELLTDAEQPDDRLRTDRSAAYLRWRYADAPGLNYRAVAHVVDGRLRGLAIGRPRRRGRLVELTLSEVIVPQGDRTTARRLMSMVAACGVDHVATHVAGWPTVERARRRAAYFAVPGQSVLLVARPLVTGMAVSTSLDDWALSLGDLEVF